MRKGYIQLYIGNGKGKTTAVIGLAIRALGADLKVAFLQFFKPDTSSEVNILKQFAPKLLYKNFHTEGFVRGRPSIALQNLIKEAYNFVKDLIYSHHYDLIILDEFLYALNWQLVELNDFLQLLKSRPPGLEIAITGRTAPQELIDLADLVTEMKNIKHYYERGVKARWGIEM